MLSYLMHSRQCHVTKPTGKRVSATSQAYSPSSSGGRRCGRTTCSRRQPIRRGSRGCRVEQDAPCYRVRPLGLRLPSKRTSPLSAGSSADAARARSGAMAAHIANDFLMPQTVPRTAWAIRPARLRRGRCLRTIRARAIRSRCGRGCGCAPCSGGCGGSPRRCASS